MFSDATLKIIDRGVFTLKTHLDARDDPWYASHVFLTFDSEVNAVFSWKSKEEYLEWRKNWKETYRATSLMSKGWKARRKESHPEYAGMDALRHVSRLRTNARALLWIRAEGKKRSWAQRKAKEVINT